MRSPFTLIITVLSLFLFSLGAFGEVQLRQLDADESATTKAPEFKVVSQDEQSLRLSFELDELALEKIEAGGELFDAVSIPEGNIRGAIGHPGLPVISKLIAMPGTNARVNVISREEETFQNMRLLPVQPDDAESFTMDESAYLRPSLDPLPLAEIAHPGMMRGLRVASMLINPVHYDPVTREMRVTRRMEVEIEFESDRVAPAEFIPESFHLLYQDMILGYEDSGFFREGETKVGPGTYLMIYDNVSGILGRLDPLIELRQKQGYNVITASTDETGTSNWQIEDYIDATYASADPPLEYVALVGDAGGFIGVACFYESISGYGGEGDHYYSMIEGDDVLADVHIGRLSVSSNTELEDVVDKIVTYETNPPTTDSGWFTRAGVTGDPSSSGISTIYVNQWLKEQLLSRGYTQVDTIWGGNFVSLMTTSINQGLSAFGYRGYWFMSGMSSSNIMNLNNGKELPFSIIVTCDTGSFASDSNCRSEAFFRAPNGGGIASVGTATIGTHTRYNNCYYMGAWHGAINGADHRTGSAHTRGKFELYNNYQLSEPNKVEIWSMWNNLMGDPATQLWSAYPEDLNVSHPAALPSGASAVPVTVTSGGLPVEGARVAIYKEGEYSHTQYTNDLGEANLPLADVTSGILYVTVMKLNHMPYMESLALGTVSTFPTVENYVVDDDNLDDSQGNGDGQLNPGETIELPVSLKNLGSATATGVSAILSSDDPFVSIVDGNEDFGDIAAGAEVWSLEDYDFIVADDAPNGHLINLDLMATNGFQSWSSLIQLEVHSAEFAYENFSWSEGSSLDPGQSGELSLMIRNDGDIHAMAVTGMLGSSSPWVVFHEPEASYGLITAGSSAENSSAAFQLTVHEDCVEGHQANFTLMLTFNDGATDQVEFSLMVGSTGAGEPTGPDAYGYYAFDNTDTDYDQAPVYDWIEVDPNQGGSGTDLGLTDFDWAQDDTKTLSLPFDFQYYGDSYDKISICSNGWLSMGETSLTLFRNFNIPSSASPSAMIAGFYDDLEQSASNKVYTYHDVAQHRFIVQWSRLRNNVGNATQNFEIILLDPAYYPTRTGDGQILMQYQTVNNTDYINGYASVGIQNMDRDDGITYTYWNQYPSSAATLTTGRAILFAPMDQVPYPSCEVTPGNITKIVAPGEIAMDWLHISNQGDEGTTLNFSIEYQDASLPREVVDESPVIDLDRDGRAIAVISPNGGETWNVGEERDILFSAGGETTSVDIYLRRGVLGNYNLIAENVPAASGSYSWVVPAPGEESCKIKIIDSDDAGIFDESNFFFTIQNSLDWLQLSANSGSLAVGETADIQVTLDGTNMGEGTYRAMLVIAHNGGATVRVPVTFVVNETGTGVDELPVAVFLARNHPNPFNPKTSISFGLPEASDARLAVYDAAGRLVRVLASGMLDAGVHAYHWDGRDAAGARMSSGIYFATLQAGDISLKQKMVLLK
ncbi:T9SS type A sorting domain-containing protein [bacterium]|nr:T9SS type A sorting domain-containing protein [bacterium]